MRCRRCSGRRPRTRRSGRHRGRSAWPLGGWRPRCRTARCLLCERRGALPLGLRLLGVLPRLASRAQRALRARVVPAAVLIVPALVVRSARALRARVVPAAVLIVPATPARPPLLDFCASAVEVLQSNVEALGVSEPECGQTPDTQTNFTRFLVLKGLGSSSVWGRTYFSVLIGPPELITVLRQ